MKTRHRVSVLLLCSLAFVCTAAPAQTIAADQVAAQANRLYSEQGPRAALPEYERALALYREAKNTRGEAITLGLIGNCHKRLGELPRALEYLRLALVLKQQLGERLEEGKTLSHLGLVYWEMGDYGQAIDHLSRSIAIAREVPDQNLEAAALNNLGLVYDEQGEFQRSLEQYQRALELHRAANSAQRESATLGNIGGVHLLLGRYREAMRYYQEALAISERLNLRPSASQDLGNIALCQLGLGEPAASLSTFDRALALAQDAGLKKEEADWHKGKGSTLLRLGRYSPALEQYRLAIETYEQAGLRRELIEALNDIGNLHVSLGDIASGEHSFQRALDLARSIGHPRGVTSNLIALGDLERRRKRYAQAEALYQEALTRARIAEDQAHMASSLLQLALTHRDQTRWEEALKEAQEALTISRQTGGRPLEAQALYRLGELAHSSGRLESALQHYAAGEEIVRDMGDPELGWQIGYGQGQTLEAMGRHQEAIAAYQRAVAMIESVRSKLLEDRFRAGYMDDKWQVYVALVRLLLRAGRSEEGFVVAEKLRARSYSQLLTRSGARQASPAETELRERIRQLQRTLEQENARPARDRRAQVIALFSSELAAAERTYHTLLDDLRSVDPQYAAARALTVPSVGQVQRLLSGDTALVEYVAAENSLMVFVVKSSGLRTTTVPLRAVDLRSRVELLRDLILRSGSQEWRKPAESLRRVLFDPIEKNGWLENTSRLYIVPHGILHYLPFGVLPRTGTTGSRFLVEDYVLAYLPAAAALLEQGELGEAERTLFALAPARARLRYAQAEARSIQKFFPQQSQVLIGSQATETSFRRSADRYRLLHLATHGSLNQLNPLLSAVELEPDPQEDGRLEVHEILGLRFKADLVTLSACETALGSGYFTDVPAGDDFVGLTRAFRFAGTASVLATLWEVNDRSTLTLMRSFYGQLRRADKAEALALAQRAMLRGGGRYVHPYFWGPFVLVGEMK